MFTRRLYGTFPLFCKICAHWVCVLVYTWKMPAKTENKVLQQCYSLGPRIMDGLHYLLYTFRNSYCLFAAGLKSWTLIHSSHYVCRLCLNPVILSAVESHMPLSQKKLRKSRILKASSISGLLILSQAFSASQNLNITQGDFQIEQASLVPAGFRYLIFQYIIEERSLSRLSQGSCRGPRHSPPLTSM